MDQYIDNKQKEIFWNLLANPADEGASYLQSLERLVSDHPQSAILQVLAARAKGIQSASKAAAYIDPRLLHKLISDPQNLPRVEAGSVTDFTHISTNGFAPATTIEPQPAVIEDAVIVDPYEAIREPDPVAFIDEEVTVPIAEQHIDEPVIAAEPEDVAEGPISEEGQQMVTDVYAAEQRFGEPIDEEPIDEIAEAPQVFSTPEQIQEAIGSIAGHTEQHPNEVTEQPTENKFFKEEIPAKEPEAERPIAETPVEQTAEVTEEKPAEVSAQPEYRFSPRFPKREVPVTPEPEYPKTVEPIEDEVYDEIVGIDDIGFKPMTGEPNAETATEHRFSEPAAEPAPEEEAQQPSVQFHQPADAATEPVQDYREVKDEEEKLILGGIVGGDYLSFDKKLDELRGASGYVAPKFKPEEPKAQPVPVEEKAPEPVQPAAQAEQATSAHTIDSSNVSRYDDDKMPYTFLWWLNKTRKEHAENLRPYAERGVQQIAGNNNLDGLKRADELQQQYFENIFSLTSVSGVERDNSPERLEFDPEKKEDVIIERFIQSDPQIKPLSADKLDNENKAKRSSEDSNEVVTETLARIYADQMLYHKAIATYKKLILKFPEKSAYFAARIEELEKKTN